MKKLLVLFMSVAMLVVVASAWATGDSEPKGPATVSAKRPANWTEAKATKAFTYHVSAANLTLHRWSTTTNNTIRVIGYLMFDPIVHIDEEGNIIPWLAKSWKLADDFSSVTFQLRDDVYFTNGVQMTADDLVFAFELLRDDKAHYPDAQSKGWRDYLATIEKIDNFSFKLNLKKPMPQFWVLITEPSFGVFCKSAYQQMGYDAFWQAPVGTGPYVVKSWDKANSICKLTIRTDKNGYWAYKNSDRWTNVKDISIQYSPEATTRIASLRAGEVQMIDTIPTTEKVGLEKEGFTVKVMPPVNAVFLQAACAKGDILDNQKLREALSLCIDRDLIVDALLSGFAIPITWPAGPGYLGYENKKAIVFDKAKAVKLVAESGYQGEPIDFIYTTSTVNIGNELTQAIQSMAKEVGINLKIRPLESAVYNDARTKHDYDLCLAAIGNDRNMWWKIGAEVIGNDRFNTGFQNEKLKALGKALQATADAKVMDGLYKQIYAIETTEFAPNIYLYWPTIVNAWSAKVRGVLLHNTQYPDLNSLVVDY